MESRTLRGANRVQLKPSQGVDVFIFFFFSDSWVVLVVGATLAVHATVVTGPSAVGLWRTRRMWALMGHISFLLREFLFGAFSILKGKVLTSAFGSRGAARIGEGH